MAKLSAGILLYRIPAPGDPEVFLAHPGGPFWAKKDDGAWSVPKGLIEPDEDEAAAARREFAEEIGAVPTGPLARLGEFRQAGGKRVVIFALMGDFDPAALSSNTFEMEWPPRSGRQVSVPEIDRAGWFTLDAARHKLNAGQVPALDALLAHLRH